MPEEATTHVWMTVFSCLVNGCFKRPQFSRNLVHVFTKKNPKRPAETLREGIIPAVRFSFITIKLNNTLSIKLTPKALHVSWFLHDGTSCFANILSTDSSPSSSPSGFLYLLLSSSAISISKPFSTFSSLPFWSIFLITMTMPSVFHYTNNAGSCLLNYEIGR